MSVQDLVPFFESLDGSIQSCQINTIEKLEVETSQNGT